MLITDCNIKNAFIDAEYIFDTNKKGVDDWITLNQKKALSPFVDSRIFQSNGLFIALQGEKVDGHSYLEQAIDNGAIALLIEKSKMPLYFALKDALKSKVLCIVVANTLQSFISAAHWWRTQLDMPIVGITGSMGKTSTKEITAHIFRENNKKIGVTYGNQNSLIGLSITILKTEQVDQYAIFEMGINEVGEMAELVGLARPTTSVLTGLAHAHTEGLLDFSTLIIEKSKIFFQLAQKQYGIIHEKYRPLIQSVYSHQWFIVGQTKACDLWFEQSKIDYIENKRFIYGWMHTSTDSIAFSFLDAAPGRLEHILLSVAIAIIHGISIADACKTITTFSFVKGRFEKKKLPGSKSFFIDDACNANPETMIESIDFFERMETALHKVLVLGSMLELGAYEQEGHRAVLQKVISCKTISKVILVGPSFLQEKIGLLFQTELFCCTSYQEADLALSQIVNDSESIVLLKSSKSVGLSLLVRAVLDPEMQIES